MALVGPEPGFLTADGRRGAGTEAVRELLNEFLAALRSTAHRVTAQWHLDDVWVAEVEADYELQDWLALKALPRVFILRMGEAGCRRACLRRARTSAHRASHRRRRDVGGDALGPAAVSAAMKRRRAGSVLLPVALDRVCVADARLVRILPELLARPSLPEQVPAAVELDLERPETPLIFL